MSEIIEPEELDEETSEPSISESGEREDEGRAHALGQLVDPSPLYPLSSGESVLAPAEWVARNPQLETSTRAVGQAELF